MPEAKADVRRWRRPKQPPAPIVIQAAPVEPQPGLLARSQVFRFRYHLVPFWWLLGLLAAGLGAYARHAVPAAAAIGVAAAVGIAVLCRHLKGFALRAALTMAGLSAVLVPALAIAGPRPVLAVALACWAAVTVPWVNHYRIRPQDPAPQIDMGDLAIWERLAAKHKWHGQLGPREEIPGGRAYEVILDGAETHIGEVMAHPRAIAAAWRKAATEAYVEPAPTGIESLGRLTLLASGTLAKIREWDGAGADPATGRAVIARFADGQDASIRFWVPRDGTRHGLVAGATGSGKTYTLDLIVRAAVASGLVVPVILDPQEGQSLPQWRGHVPYASGVAECMEMLEGVHSAVLGRSRKLADWDWVDEDGHPMHGMDFFDPRLTGLPVILVLGDELPLLLKPDGRSDQRRAERAVMMMGNISKVARKAGAAVWVAVQVPSLEELVSRVLRSMLTGCNLVCLRTGERADAGMIGFDADPSKLPRYFADGTPTAGLGYVVGPEMRQAPARIDMVPRAVRRQIPQVPELDTMFAKATRLEAVR